MKISLPTIKLKPQRPERLTHPWIYDNEIADGPIKGTEDGALVRVRDARGQGLGVAYYNSQSKIIARYLSRRGDEVIDADFWKRRVRAALDYRRARFGDPLPPFFRLSHGESDGLPGFVADVYGPFVVVQFLALGLEPWREVLTAAVLEAMDARGVYERSDSGVRKLEGLEEKVGLLAGDEPPEILEIESDGLTILADLKTGAKTGLFLDQRENQAAAAKEARNRDVLNCFSYTGLFGLRAAQNGAKSVTDVELSAHFNAVNEAQWETNSQIIPHSVVTENVFDYLRALDEKKYRTEMVILDPPAFTKNRGSVAGAARGYNEINRTALKILKRGGVLVTCSCSYHLTAGEFREIVQNAAHDAGRSLKLIEARGQPADHPVSLDAPESEYLKCLILSVE